ncbi:ANR family transcriptional regulator [Moraxella nasovis]|uniref:ANR family transcriptional regulator n=1 Tax=Moraxella nasovis TaxID=2904121 RepID=UPI0035CCF153
MNKHSKQYQAAMCERSGHFRKAQSLWKEAMNGCLCSINHEYYKKRYLFCKSLLERSRKINKSSY